MKALAALATLTALAVAVPAHAEFQLGSRYQDNDGDLVADIPSDAAEQIDPDTLIFAYTPVEDPAVYREVWSEFLDHMAETTGKTVQFFPVQSNAAQIEAMRAGRLHVAGFNTGSNPIAVACAGFRPFAMMAGKDGSFGYEMEIITYPDSGIDEVADIKGKTLTHTSQTSNSGFKAPTALMKAEFGMISGEDYDTQFSGKHDNSILGVANKDYEVATVANSVKKRMIERGVVSDDQFNVLYTSQTFPTTGYGTVYNLTPELQEKIHDAFFSFDWAGSGLEEEFGKNGEAQFIEITFKKDWDVIRKIDDANGVTYDCQ
ncbi:phosphate/phosphite/phosphonate ABC transporter substrate-binding protein [Amorphus coralli]|uniref:phosphate/phosphite/phosphonate ABC transporter substrate-binding protein n=1 Tax=Amorphus coralli TaxID=340680 RepID=UPI00037FA571|nr:phosphate/phosphite/phosphonate ABC transporter substrate-binding protein [Amorphus coralli]